MSSLADFAELRGFFSYSREDDEDSSGGLSALRDRIQRELRSQLGRSTKTFGLWQDKEAIAPGSQWETEIKNAVDLAHQMVDWHHLVEFKGIKELALSAFPPTHHEPLPPMPSQSNGIIVRESSQ